MSLQKPHFLLYSEASSPEIEDEEAGQWRFLLESIDGQEQIEAEDIEADVYGERLELLAVVRGLEALDQPSKVTLVTPSRYVTRGLRNGIPSWRESGWMWERFGEMAPVKNGDLWKRVDRAMDYHKVECRFWRFDSSHARQADAVDEEANSNSTADLRRIDNVDQHSVQKPSETARQKAFRLIRRLVGRKGERKPNEE